MLLGIFSALYKIFFYDYLAPHFKYKVTKIERLLDILNIYLTPLDKTLHFHPGQFVYAKFHNAKVGAEPHPFSLSSSTHEKTLPLSVKILGDYTLRLPYLNEDDPVTLFGPYGTFGGHHHGKSLWIGGGIGITPFLGMLLSEKENPSYTHIDLVYTYRNPEDGVFTPEIHQSVKLSKHISFHPWCSSEKSHLNIETITQFSSLDYDSVFLCGPKPMMQTLAKQLIERGLNANKIHFENFDLL